MRFLVAAVLFTISTALILTGVAQRTILAPPSQYNMTFEPESSAAYGLIPNDVLTLYPGTIEVKADGGPQAFLALGRESDIEAYIGESKHMSLVAKPSTKEVEAKDFAGTAPTVNPSNSDLWRAQVEAPLAASLPVSAEDGGAVLIASNGLAPIPPKIDIIWKPTFDPTPSGVLIWIGLVLLAIAVVLTLYTFRTMRINRGPRRRTPKPPKPPRYKYRSVFKSPQRGRRSARGFIALTSGALTLTLLSGCASNPEVTASPTPAEQTEPVSLKPVQVQRILDDVSIVAREADAANDRRILVERFDGAALAVRTTNYQLRSRNARIASLQAIAATPIKFNLPAATSSWPRVAMAVTDEEGDTALPQMIVMQQNSPRENYKVWFTIRLMPGAEIPAVPSSEIGAIPVDAASLFLKLPPNKLPIAFGDVLNQGQASLSAQLFDLDNEFYRQVSQAQKDQAESLNNANITYAHLLGDPNVISMATSNGGALVAVYQLDRYTIRPKRANSAVAVGAQERLLLGATGSTRGVRSVYGDMLLFYVPPAGADDKIVLLGATQGLISVVSL
jgi:hypothetical protein